MTSATSLDPYRQRRASPADPVPLVVGTMNFGKRTSEAEARRIVDAAFDHGVPCFDTANVYVDGEGERILGRALAGRRGRAIVATKVGLLRFGGTASGLLTAGGTPEGLSKARILAACDESLARLGTDCVDVYYLHVPDAATPIEESLEGMAELLSRGKIRAFAFSNYASWQALEMIHWCDRAGVARPVLAQQMYNVLVRQLDVEYLAFAARYGLHTCAYNPLAGGLLARPVTTADPAKGSRFDQNPMYQRRYWTEKGLASVRDYHALAAAFGMSTLELAYGWLASRPGVDSIVVGPGTAEHLTDAVRAVERRLSPDVMERVDALHALHQGTDARYARL